MTCGRFQPHYVPPSNAGIIDAISQRDGYGVAISWYYAFPDRNTHKVAYHIYYSTNFEDVFSEGVKLISVSDGYAAVIQELTPGDTYYFAVRAFQYDPSVVNLSLLPNGGDLKLYPEGMLLSNITENSTSIPVSDLDQFPSHGIVRIGSEFIHYTNKDLPNNSLTGLTRGYYETNIRLHNIDGYDGYYTHENPLVRFWGGLEEMNTVIYQETANFAYPNYAFTFGDGYKSVEKDLVTTDLSGSDASQGGVTYSEDGTRIVDPEAAFPRYDYAGWHRTDPVALLRGDCVGTYYGGEQYCADGYSGVGRQLRGMPFEDENHRRQEMLLELTGEPVVLVRKMREGIRCKCFSPLTEIPDDRCPSCYGSGFVSGYQQFFNPRRSDGRILVRFGPTEDDLKIENAGRESSFIPDCWTLVFPAIKDRDFIIRFNEDGTEEFRYEILNVTRNKLLNSFSGSQKFRAQRIRKTDPIYQVGAIRDTSTIPQELTTSIGILRGSNGAVVPHAHVIVVNEGITTLSQINQDTSVSRGHSHRIYAGIVEETLGHTHEIILP